MIQSLFASKKSKASPADLVRGLREGVARLESGGSGASEGKKKANEEVSRILYAMKMMLFGEGESEPSPDLVAQLAQEVYANEILQLLVNNIWRFEFEARKDVSQIFNSLLRRQIGQRLPTVEYLSHKDEAVFAALQGYDNPDVALNTGMILREMLRHETLAKILLYSDHLYDFFRYIEETTFGIACDAQANLKEALTRHKPLVADFLAANYDRFFSAYAQLVQSDNYVTKRQSLKLLSELLLDRTNFSVMTRYIADENNLKMIMNALRDKSKNIQFEAFHVFKVFVANPKKPPQIESILRRNKDKAVLLLQGFHNDKDDEQFNDEKQFLIAQLSAL